MGYLGLIPGLGRSSGEGNGYPLQYSWGFPGGSDSEEFACNLGDPGLIPGLERSASHSSILAWRIPWTEKPGGLQSMGLQRVGHNWVTVPFTMQIYFWALCCVLLIRMYVFVPIPRCFDYCSSVVVCEVWDSYISCFVFFSPSGLLWHFWAFCSSMYIFGLFYFCEKCNGYFDRDHIESVDCHLTVLILPTQEHGIFFHFSKSALISFINVL